ncbi:unnamed protein product [Adineta steineri]|uniref:DUF2059 domain-containing protein n=1 Tax=Adineta steineri TaxID=433720 RepID=A0A815RG04_9BILA|nr:unnamed protein product [Adineta steineri]
MLIVFITGCIFHQAVSSELKKLALPSSSSKEQFLNRTLEFLKITGSEELYDATIKMILDSHSTALGPFKTKLEQLLAECCSYSSLKYELAKIYMQEFTLNDINRMIRFYSTPVGKKLTRKQSVLMVKAKELGERKMREQLPKLQAMIGEESNKFGYIE